jgi:hypothetical protein
MASAVMLAAVDENRPLFDDTSPNAVRSFGLLGPDTAEPNAPLFEFIGSCWITAMVNSNAIPVAQENDISLLPHDRVETIDFFPGVQDDISQRLA